MAVIANLQTLITGNSDSFQNATKSADKDAKGLIATLGGMKTAVAGMALGGAAFAFKWAVDAASRMESLEIQFRTMLGSGEKAKQLMADLNKFAAKTPFETEELATAAKGLLAYGFGQEEIIANMTRLGDVASGLNIPLVELVDIYGKVKSDGRVMAEQLNIFMGRGIPLAKELAKQFGINESEVRDLVSTGQVGFANLEQAFISMTTNGTGIFAGGMDALSNSTQGVLSTLSDSLNMFAVSIGNELLPSIKDLATNATGFIDSFQGAGALMGATLEAMELAWLGASAAINYAVLAGVIAPLHIAAKLIDTLSFGYTNLSEATGIWMEEQKKAANKLESSFKAAWNDKPVAQTATESVASLNKELANTPAQFQAIDKEAQKVAKTATDMVADLQNEIATFGMSGNDAKIFSLRQQGADSGTLAQAEQLAKQLEQMESQKTAAEDLAKKQEQQKKDLESSAKNVLEDIKTPMEKYNDKVAELSKMLNAGLIDEDAFNKASKKSFDDIVNKDKQEPSKWSLPTADLLGSQAASTAVARHSVGLDTEGNSIDDKLLKENQSQTELLAKLVQSNGGKLTYAWSGERG